MSFEKWISFSFDRPVTDPQWYWSEESDKLSDDIAIEYLTQLFSSPIKTLNNLTEPQVNQGIWYIISPGSSPCIDSLFSDKVDWEKRKKCIDSIYTLFSDYFFLKCLKKLSHCDIDGSLAQKQPLNLICYMFWDLIPWHADSSDRKVYLAYLDVIEKILKLDHVACRESALHGLGHSQSDYPERIEKVIDNFLEENPTLGNELKKYALSARAGYVA